MIEEGLPMETLQRVVASMRQAADEVGVEIVTGDTKVVNQGSADKLFINTAGVGIVPERINISAANARPGDRIIINGNIGDHGIAVLSQREGLKFKVPVESDCAPLNKLVAEMLATSTSIHCLRDPTRGGLATVAHEISRATQLQIKLEQPHIPVREAVVSVCDMLGYDPLYLACEGRVVAVVDGSDADTALQRWQALPEGESAVMIGEVVDDEPFVVLETELGGSRILDELEDDDTKNLPASII